MDPDSFQPKTMFMIRTHTRLIHINGSSVQSSFLSVGRLVVAAGTASYTVGIRNLCFSHNCWFVNRSTMDLATLALVYVSAPNRVPLGLANRWNSLTSPSLRSVGRTTD